MKILQLKRNAITLLLCLFLSITILQAQTVNLTEVKGHELQFKPSIANRINGCKEVVLLTPMDMSKYDEYIFSNLSSYFRSLGLYVSRKPANYQWESKNFPEFQILWKIMTEPLDRFWDNSNTLLCIATTVASVGNLPGGYHDTFQMYLVDPLYDFQWVFRFDLPKKSDKFQKKLRNEITSSYFFNQAASHSPSYYKSDWYEDTFRQYFNTQSYSPLEGVYEGDNYRLGLIKHQSGKYLLIYLEGASNTNDWWAGDVKAILEPTATPTIFISTWYNKWKQKTSFRIVFTEGIMTVYDENKNPETYIKLYPAQ